MDIYASLFSASIALLGFIAVFLVFRYKTIDTYADDRKATLRSLLEDQIKTDPYIVVIIQNIGKKQGAKDACSFFQLIKERLAKERLADKEDLDKKPKTKEAVKEFFDAIIAYRTIRNHAVCRGLTSIFIWGVLSLIYLLIHVMGPCLFDNIRCFDILLGIMVCLFIVSMIFTLYFVYKSLC